MKSGLWRTPHKNRYVPGARWRECDECGQDYLTTELFKRERDGAIVCKYDLEEGEKYERVRVVGS